MPPQVISATPRQSLTQSWSPSNNRANQVRVRLTNTGSDDICVARGFLHSPGHLSGIATTLEISPRTIESVDETDVRLLPVKSAVYGTASNLESSRRGIRVLSPVDFHTDTLSSQVNSSMYTNVT
jgi:hypothetical protein